MPDAYRAWIWQGSPSPADLVPGTIERQPLRPGEVLVRNAVIGLNPVDWKVLGGDLVDWRPGKVPGVDGAGTVAAIAEGLPGDWLGRRVAYHQNLGRPGSFAEYTPVRADVLLRVPSAVDLTVAASIPCPALTAWQAIEKLPVQPGRPLLVGGAGGAVGHYLVQFAVARGFAVTTMSHPRHWERLRALGAQDCANGPLPSGRSLPEHYSGGFYAAIDCVDAAHAARLAPALEANGHIVCIQGRLEQWPCPPFGPAPSMHEVALGALHRFGNSAAWNRLTAAGEDILDGLASRSLIPEELVIHDFGELPTLLDALRHRAFSGKPLIRL